MWSPKEYPQFTTKTFTPHLYIGAGQGHQVQGFKVRDIPSFYFFIPNYALKNHSPCEIELPYSNTLVFGLSYFTGQGLHKIITRQVSKEFATIRLRYVLHLKGEKSYLEDSYTICENLCNLWLMHILGLFFVFFVTSCLCGIQE